MRKRTKIVIYFLVFNVIFFLLSAPLVVFYGPFHSLKQFAVGTIATSRHPQVAEFFLSKTEIVRLLQSSQETVTVEPVIFSKDQVYIDHDNGLRIEKIQSKYFRGMVMQVKNPAQIRVAVTRELGTAGQRLSELVAEAGAVAGINGGGFYDPNAQGNGAFPEGITVSGGAVVHNSLEDNTANIIGFNGQGKLILKELKAQEIRAEGIREGVSFLPNLLLESEPQIVGDGGWGLAPRTGIGQKADGTVIMIVIDGRLPGWSMGATLRDLMNVFIEYGAVNAANLDGGSSTEMIYNGQVVNRLWNIYGERYIPTAFVVLPQSSVK